MRSDSARGNVLILGEDETSTDQLCRWVAAAGELPLPVSGREKFLFDGGADERVDLVVTCLTGEISQTRTLLDRLLTGEIFFGVPQLHVVSDPTLQTRIDEVGPDLAAESMSSPPEAEEFKSRVRLASEVGRLRREVSRASIQDPLTGAYNRRFLLMRLAQEFSRARRYRTPLSIVLMDIDQLKGINDSYGLDVGDRALLQISRVIGAHTRKEDIQGRWGAASFMTILPGTPHRGAAVFANKVRGDAEAFRVTLDELTVQIKVSAGISSFNTAKGEKEAIELLKAAEQALTEAKNRGGNRVFIDETTVRRERPVVVIADTDSEFVDLAEDLLSMEDYRVVRVESINTLTEAVKFRSPDVLIVNLQLEGEQDPTTLVEQIRHSLPDRDAPLIGIADRQGPGLDELGKIGVDRYMTKPFSVALLRTLVREVAEEHRRVRLLSPRV